jgi:ferredoxin
MIGRGSRLRVDPIGCTGHGLCAELLPELIRLDDWGYPIIVDGPVPSNLIELAKRTVTACPALALRLEQEAPVRSGSR